MVIKKYTFKLWDTSQEYASCWHCGEKTFYFLNDLRTGEEIFVCPVCALKIYKLKKIVARLMKYSQKQKSSRIKSNLHIKNPENARYGAVAREQEDLR